MSAPPPPPPPLPPGHAGRLPRRDFDTRPHPPLRRPPVRDRRPLDHNRYVLNRQSLSTTQRLHRRQSLNSWEKQQVSFMSSLPGDDSRPLTGPLFSTVLTNCCYADRRGDWESVVNNNGPPPPFRGPNHGPPSRGGWEDGPRGRERPPSGGPSPPNRVLSPRRPGPGPGGGFRGPGPRPGLPRDELPHVRGGERRMDRPWEGPKSPPIKLKGGPGMSPGMNPDMNPGIPFLRRPPQMRLNIRGGPLRRIRTPPTRPRPPPGVHGPPVHGPPGLSREPPGALREPPGLPREPPGPPQEPPGGGPMPGRSLGPDHGPSNGMVRPELRRRWEAVGGGSNFSDFPSRGVPRDRPGPAPNFEPAGGPRGRERFLNRTPPPLRIPLRPPIMNRLRDGPPGEDGRTLPFAPMPPFPPMGGGKNGPYRPPGPPRPGSGPPWMQRLSYMQRRRSGGSLPRFNHDREGPKEPGDMMRRHSFNKAIKSKPRDASGASSSSSGKRFPSSKSQGSDSRDADEKRRSETPSQRSTSEKDAVGGKEKQSLSKQISEESNSVSTTVEEPEVVSTTKNDLQTEKVKVADVRNSKVDAGPNGSGSSAQDVPDKKQIDAVEQETAKRDITEKESVGKDTSREDTVGKGAAPGDQAKSPSEEPKEKMEESEPSCEPKEPKTPTVEHAGGSRKDVDERTVEDMNVENMTAGKEGEENTVENAKDHRAQSAKNRVVENSSIGQKEVFNVKENEASRQKDAMEVDKAVLETETSKGSVAEPGLGLKAKIVAENEEGSRGNNEIHLASKSLDAVKAANVRKKVDTTTMDPYLFSSTIEILSEFDRIDEAIAKIRKTMNDLCPALSLPSFLPAINEVPVNSETFSQIRSILSRNQTTAKAAAAAFRPICADIEVGLDAPPSYKDFSDVSWLTKPMTETVLDGVSKEISHRRAEEESHHLRIRRRYCRLQKRWKRRLRKREDERSHEKKKRDLERDRFLVASNYTGTSGITRSSSGRVCPSSQEVDMMLSRIKAEGGTPGSVDIWSTTLADIPDQDRSCIPYDGSSVLIEDPLMHHFAAQAVNPWSREEKVVFLEKFLVYQKNFRKISTFLKHKSTQDCVDFYYKNKINLGLKDLAKIIAGVKKKDMKKAILEARAGFRPNFNTEGHLEGFDYDLLGLNNNASDDQPINMYSRLGVRDEEVGELSRRDIGIRWPARQSALFLNGLVRYGLDFRSIASFVGARTMDECKEYYHQNKRRFNFEQYIPSAEKEPQRMKTIVWTPMEEEIFNDYFSKLGRNWEAIAEHLPVKTASQVKDYWRKHYGGSFNERRREANGDERAMSSSKAKDIAPNLQSGEREMTEFEMIFGCVDVDDNSNFRKRNAKDAGFSDIPSAKRSRDDIEETNNVYVNGAVAGVQVLPNGGTLQSPSSLDILASSATETVLKRD